MNAAVRAGAVFVLALCGMHGPPTSSRSLPPQAAHREVLENGIGVTYVPVPQVERQTTLTIVPIGVLGDGRGRAQYSHLLEHMLIRSTDPDELELEGFELTSRTAGSYLLLESKASESHWKEALLRHASWLQTEHFDGETLEKEKERILDEIDDDVAGKTAHLWALGAWSQVVRFDVDHVGLREAILEADVADVEEELARRVPIGATVEIYAIGPVLRTEVAAVLEREVASLERRSPATPDVAEPIAPPEKIRERCTWDLPARYLVVWYPLPTSEPRERLATWIAYLRLQEALYRRADDLLAGGRTEVFIEELRPGEPLLVVSVALDDDTKVKSYLSALDGEMKGLARSKGISNNDLIQALPQQLDHMTNVGAAVERFLSFMSKKDLDEFYERGLEREFVYQGIELERISGMDLQAIRSHFPDLDSKSVKAMTKSTFPKKARRHLLLEPKGR